MPPSAPKLRRVDDNTLSLTCFRCGKQHQLCLKEIKAAYTFRMRCSCGQPYQFGKPERREHERKTLSLPGVLLDVETSQHIDDITVTSLSQRGFSIRTQQRQLQVGEAFIISLRLDDEQKTQLEESIIIRSVTTHQEAGAELIESYCFDLDVYLNP